MKKIKRKYENHEVLIFQINTGVKKDNEGKPCIFSERHLDFALLNSLLHNDAYLATSVVTGMKHVLNHAQKDIDKYEKQLIKALEMEGLSYDAISKDIIATYGKYSSQHKSSAVQLPKITHVDFTKKRQGEKNYPENEDK